MPRALEPSPNATVTSCFDAHELERLEIYRRAVQAGLFTDSVPDDTIAIRRTS
jgi:hypothetical protein